MDFVEINASASSGSNRTISEVCGDRTGIPNRNGQGGYKSTTYGGCGGVVVGRCVKRKWSQEDVDACTHFTEQRYSEERYEKFSLDERQRVW